MDLESLIERLSAGEAIDPDAIPPALLARPEVQRLLTLARVMHRLDVNAGTSPATEIPIHQPAPTRLGPFKLLRLLGTGGMSEVWLGQRDDGQAEQTVAVKRVRAGLPGFAARLVSERRILARLEHPNIARFIDAGVDDSGLPWLALEYVDGMAITDWCAHQALSLEQRLILFGKVCAAVDHAHRQLVVHRDLKPANVLVDARGEPRLLDFGIAQLLDGHDSEATSTTLTPSYAAPEQLQGQPVGTAADVYALGLLLFRVLAGQLPPGRRSNGVAAMLAQLDLEDGIRPSAEALPHLPYPAAVLRGDLDAIVAQALRADPASRYRTAQDLAGDLQRHLAARPVRARPPTRRYRLGRFLQRNRAASTFAGLALLSLLLGSALALDQARQARAAAAVAVHEAETARRALARADQTTRFLESLFREQDPLARSGSSARSLSALLGDGVARVQTELADDPEGQLSLLLSLAEAQHGQGLGTEASSTLVLAEALLEPLNWPDAQAARFHFLQARLAELSFRLPDALEHYAQAENLASRAHGTHSLEWASIRREQARALVTASDFPAAFAAAGEAHESLVSLLGPLHLETALALYQLGLVREQKREDQAALIDFEAVVLAIEQTRGADHALLIRPLMSLGDVQRRLRRFADGRATLQRGAAIAAEHLGQRHAQRASILIRLGTLERDAGDLAAAIAALETAEASVPEGEAGTLAQLLASRGAIHNARGEPAAAEPDLKRAMELRHAGGGRSNGLAWYSQAEWAATLAQLGRLEQALALLHEARAELASLLGPEAYQNSLIAARLGTALDLAGEHAEAAAELAEAERLVIARAGADNHNALMYRLQRAQALGALSERSDEARELVASLRAAAANSADLAASLESRGLSSLEARLTVD